VPKRRKGTSRREKIDLIEREALVRGKMEFMASAAVALALRLEGS